jgi:hypothetical protein
LTTMMNTWSIKKIILLLIECLTSVLWRFCVFDSLKHITFITHIFFEKKALYFCELHFTHQLRGCASEVTV